MDALDAVYEIVREALEAARLEGREQVVEINQGHPGHFLVYVLRDGVSHCVTVDLDYV